MIGTIPLIFRVAYRNRATAEITYRVIGVGQSFPDIGPKWVIIGIDQYVGLIDKGRKVFTGDIYTFLHMTHPITVSSKHGLRFMHGDFQLSDHAVEFGQFKGTIYEEDNEEGGRYGYSVNTIPGKHKAV